jgi:hypothetical protein
MIVRNDPVTPRLPLTSSPAAAPTNKPVVAEAPRPFSRDTFTPAASVQRAAAVAEAPAGDHGQLMHEYLTGARPPPADFEQVMGYKPYAIQTKHGQRMQDPFGDASSPGKIGPTKEFDQAAKTHDYGYDLLRYYARKGTPLRPEARKTADAQFRQDIFDYANDQKGLLSRWKYRAWAQIYATAVELNSLRQNYGPP